jgi:hypothetical protein
LKVSITHSGAVLTIDEFFEKQLGEIAERKAKLEKIQKEFNPLQ